MKRFHILNEYNEEEFDPDSMVDFIMENVISENDVHYIIEKLKDKIKTDESTENL